MTLANESVWDRGSRVVGGAALMGLGWSGVLPATLSIVGVVVGAVALATGIIGWCPAYSVFGISTRQGATAARGPRREAGQHQ